MASCRITVVKRSINEDLIEQHVSEGREPFGRCKVYEDGQEFIIEG